MQVDLSTVQYAGFWSRFFAAILDSIVQAIIVTPILYLLLGPAMWSFPEPGANGGMWSNMDFGRSGWNYVLVMLYTLLFWKYKAATPGKMLMGISIVDANTGGPVDTARLVLRYLAYIVSVIPFMLGFIWVAFDRRKQGFHDKIARTLVIRNPLP